jgi:alpha-1,2-mannosyltransferase
LHVGCDGAWSLADHTVKAFAPAMLTRRIVLFLALSGFVLNGVLWAVSPPDFKDTVLRHTWDFLHGESGGDSWLNMFVAYDYVRSPHETPLYTEVFFNRGVKFQYPPSSLFAIAAMRMAGTDRVRLGEEYFGPRPSINDILGWAFILLMVISVATLLHIQLKRSNVASESHISFAACAVIAAGFTLTFYPMMKAYTLGQIQVWLNSLFSLLLLAWVMGRKALSGVLMGLICLVKPHFGLFLVWALVRSEWRFIIGCGATIFIGLAASVAAFGWADHLDYLRVVSHMGQRGEAYYPNQSINGLLNRLMSISDPVRYNNLEFHMSEFPPFNPWVYGVTVVSSAVILLAAIARRSKDEDRAFDFCRMAVSLTVASPIAWEHHYGILLPIFAVVFPSVLEDRRRMLWLMLSYVLVSTFFLAANLLAATPFNVIQSYLLAGAFVLLALLYLPPTTAPVMVRAAADR